jgi:hypothetical protein
MLHDPTTRDNSYLIREEELILNTILKLGQM